MQKVGFLKSIHVKIVLIYVLLILLAMQIIGLYFAQELEQKLKTNFTDSIKERVNLVEFSVREEMTRKRGEEDPTPEQSLRMALSSLNSDDIIEIRVVDNRYRILATSDTENQLIVGQKSTESLVRKSITAANPYDEVKLDRGTGDRVWVLSSPIVSKGEVIGTLYLNHLVKLAV
jgi:two-component system sensor histidine kinase VicK